MVSIFPSQILSPMPLHCRVDTRPPLHRQISTVPPSLKDVHDSLTPQDLTLAEVRQLRARQRLFFRDQSYNDLFKVRHAQWDVFCVRAISTMRQTSKWAAENAIFCRELRAWKTCGGN